MEIILLQDIPKLGSKDDIVKVKTGYAVNYLIPRGLAIQATKSAKKMLEEKKRQQAKKIEKARAEAEALAEKLKDLKLQIPVKAGENGKIFGSVTNFQVADALKEKGFDIDRKSIAMPEHIKELGTYKATIKLFKDITAEIEFEVIAE